MKKKLVYLGISADIFHHGHINIINKAKKLGNLIIGLLTDKAISEKKRIDRLREFNELILLKLGISSQ